MIKTKNGIMSISLVILLSGCILETSQPLEISIMREAETTELNAVIDYLESYDILEFVNLTPNAYPVFKNFDYYSGVIIRNISHVFEQAKLDYSQSNWHEGTLSYFVTGIKVSPQNISVIETELGNKAQNFSQSLDAYYWPHYMVYYPKNETTNGSITTITEGGIQFPDELENIFLTEVMWVVVCSLRYDTEGLFMGGDRHYFAEMFILDTITYEMLVFTAYARHNQVD